MNLRSDHEPVRGLPEPLPAGETLLWQGTPAWRSLCRRLFKFPYLAGYFVLLAAWRFASLSNDAARADDAALAALGPVSLAVAALGLLTAIAWLIERTTVYTVTDKRLVIRFGIALPMSINLPFKAISSADLRLHGDGTGDIPVRLSDGQRIGYLTLWPHARPWRWRHPEPMLRCIPDAGKIAGLLAFHLSNAPAAGARNADSEATPRGVGEPAAAKSAAA